MSKYNLYVTDWAPNGTNDLLIVNKETGSVVEVIKECTFGIDVFKPRRQFTQYDCTHYIGHAFSKDEYFIGKAPKQAEFDPAFHTIVKRITLKELKQRLCVSPIDPHGADLDARLKRAGIDLGWE